jgi:hypothetical protein
MGVQPVPVSELTKDEDLGDLRRMLARRRGGAARMGLTATGCIALLSRAPADHPVWGSASDLDTLVHAGDERGA